MNKILLVFLFCITTGHHYPFLPHYSLIILMMPPHCTLLPQQATPSQSQPQPHGSSHPCTPSQSHSRHHQAAITNVPESGEEFNFSSVEHEDNSTVCSNVATANSTPPPLVQASQLIFQHIKALQGMQWISTTSSLRETQLINAASWPWDEYAACACKSGHLIYMSSSMF